jgi:tellurite resistance protein TerC
LSAVLAFAALKMLTAHFLEIGPLTSLTVIVVMLAITIALSLLLPVRKEETA